MSKLTANVRRAMRVVVRGIGPYGGERIIDAEGVAARALQHELDHLDGRVILDRAASLRHDVFRRRNYQGRRDETATADHRESLAETRAGVG